MSDLTFNPLTLENAAQDIKPTLEAVQNKFGFIPNLLGVLAINPEALKSYLGMADFLANSGLDLLEQQIVQITTSRENSCGYCIAAHSAISKMSNLDERTIADLRNGNTLSNPRHEALRLFTKRIVSAKGWVDPSDVKLFSNAGFTSSQSLAVILGVAMKTLSNYVNHMAKTSLDKNFEGFSWNR